MCDDVAAYRTSLCQSPAIWSRIRAISSSGTTTNTSDKSKRRRFVGLFYKLTKFVTRARRPMSEQPSQNTNKLTSRSADGRAKRRPTQIKHLSPHRHVTQTGYRTLRVAVWRWLLLVDPRFFWAPGPAMPSMPIVVGFAALEAGCRRVAGVSWF